jgi:hypothetical protein
MVMSTNNKNSIMRHSKTTPFRRCWVGKTRRRLGQHALYVVVLCFLSMISWAARIDGEVVNLTTGEPARGDEVILYRVDRSMHEEAHARSGEHGEFHFDTHSDLRYLVAVRHQNVAYHTRTMNGASQPIVPVYNALANLEQIREDSDTLFFELSDGMLDVTEFFVLSNASTPPRTLAGRNTFQFSIPADATLDSVAVQPPETLPIETKCSSFRKPGQYGIAFPIRPGVTKVRVKYRLPYSASVLFQRQVLRPVTAMAFIVPETMQLISDRPGTFLQSGKDNGQSVYVAKQLEPGRLPRLWLNSANAVATTLASTEETAAGSDIEVPVPDFFPESPSKQGFFADTTRIVILCFETPVVVIALVIFIAMFRNRGDVSTRRSEARNAIEAVSVGRSDRV